MTEAPSIVTEIPGPRSREILERLDRVLYPELVRGLGPFVIRRKTEVVRSARVVDELLAGAATWL